MTWITYESVVEILEEVGLDLTAWEGDGTFPKIARIIEQCQARIESECRRKFEPKTRVQTFNGPGADRVVLAEYPVIRVKSVTVSGMAVSEGGLVCDKECGILYCTSGVFTRGIQNVQVKYRYGYGTIPEELKEVLTKLAAREVIMRSPGEAEQHGLKSIRILNFSESYTTGLFSRQIEEWSDLAKDVIRRYRKVVIR